MKVGLIEHRTIARQAMKQQKKSLVDNDLTAGQSMEAVEREMNEMHREQTGGVEEEDVSRYQVTLRRLPAGATPDWTGEAVGPPAFIPSKPWACWCRANSSRSSTGTTGNSGRPI